MNEPEEFSKAVVHLQALRRPFTALEERLFHAVRAYDLALVRELLAQIKDATRAGFAQ